MSQQNDLSNATDGALLEAQFDRRIAGHGRMVGSLILLVTIVGIPLIPFWLLFSLWYYPEYLRRISARLTSHTLEVQKGVFFRSEATIPLNRITDLRLHDGPVMRYYNLRGLKVETAGMSGDTGSEGDLVGVVDASEFRDAVLSQRQKVLGREEAAGSATASEGISETLVEIRDILARIEEQGSKRKVACYKSASIDCGIPSLSVGRVTQPYHPHLQSASTPRTTTSATLTAV